MKNETQTTKRTMSEEAKRKISEAVSGIVKLSEAQEKEIKKVFKSGDQEKISKLEKLIARRKLFELTGDSKYAPKNKVSNKQKSLDELLFS